MSELVNVKTRNPAWPEKDREMDGEVRLTIPQYALFQKVKNKPRGTFLRYGLTNQRKLDELVRLGVLRIVRGRRRAMPARYAARAGIKPSVGM